MYMVTNPTMSSKKTDTSLQGKLYLCANEVRTVADNSKVTPIKNQESKRHNSPVSWVKTRIKHEVDKWKTKHNRKKGRK